MMMISDAIELFAQYILVEKGLSVTTANSYLDDLKRFIAYAKKDYVEELNGDDISLYQSTKNDYIESILNDFCVIK